MKRRFVLTLTCLLACHASQAMDEQPRHPNLVVVTIAGLADVGAPADGLEEVLPDPEIRARVTPNFERLAAMGASFKNVFTSGDLALDALDGVLPTLVEKAGYKATRVLASEQTGPPHREVAESWIMQGRNKPLLRWIRTAPEDTSIAAWEQLADSRPGPLTALAAAEQIRASPAVGQPTMLLVPLAGWTPNPAVPGIFFDRFPLEQISLSERDEARRVLAARMNVSELRTDRLDDEAEIDWKRAVQAWLARASAVDYAAGTLIDAIESANTDDDSKNDWIVVLIALPSSGREAPRTVQETGAKANLIVVASGITKPGQAVITPIDTNSLPLALTELAGVASEPQNVNRLLPLLAPAGERYDTAAITAVDGSYGVRSHRFRLVHQRRGPQQLYDLSIDPPGFIDLLDPSNEASIEKFGLSTTQVESVRQWLGWKLVNHLKSSKRTDSIEAVRKAGVFEPPADFKPVMPGDFNRDGVVNVADKTIWRDHLEDEVPYPGADADANHDGRVDQQDEEIWRANYGRRAE